jgi:hypothetical protein
MRALTLRLPVEDQTMHSFLESKLMAKALRQALAERHIDITHSDSLELVARQFGLANWNMLSAHIEAATNMQPKLPRGWYRTGLWTPDRYRMGIDPAHARPLHIESSRDADLAGAYGSLATTILADDFRGGKIRFSAELSGEGCEQAAIWMRIDSAVEGRWLRFDNLIDRAGAGPLTGSFYWTQRIIVLDVPETAEKITYGVMLVGVGTVWARSLDIGAADPDTSRTDYPRRPTGFGDGVPA